MLKIISLALFEPTRAGKKWVLARPGKIPNLVKGKDSNAFVSAILISKGRAIVIPIPTQEPFKPAINIFLEADSSESKDNMNSSSPIFNPTLLSLPSNR